jgi:hypothetical protein
VSALLLVEVIDTAGTLLDAILWWILVAGFVATVVVYTLVLTGAWAWRTARRDRTAPLAASEPSEAPFPPGPAERRSEPQPHPAPSWVRTDKEAA